MRIILDRTKTIVAAAMRDGNPVMKIIHPDKPTIEIEVHGVLVTQEVINQAFDQLCLCDETEIRAIAADAANFHGVRQ